MRMSKWTKRCVAVVCVAAVLAGGLAAYAAGAGTAHTEDVPAASNGAEDAQLQQALAKLSVAYNAEAGGWQISAPYEETSKGKKLCGLYPYLFVSESDGAVSLRLGIRYIGSHQVDLRSVEVEADGKKYTFSCDNTYSASYDNAKQRWMDYESFADFDTVSLYDWLGAQNLVVHYTGWEGNTKDYTVSQDNRQAITDVLNAYDRLNATDAAARTASLKK